MNSADTYYQDLENLGITAWLPRTALENAAPTPSWVYDYQFGPVQAVPAGTVVAPPKPVSKESAKAHLARLRSVLDSNEAGSSSPSANASSARQGLTRSLAPAPEQAPTPVPTEAGSQAGSQANEPEHVSKAAPKTASPVPQASDTSAIKPSVAPAPSAIATDPNAPKEAPRFNLAFMVYGPLLVVDAVPPNGQNGFSALHQRLQQNIVASLGITEPAVSSVAYLKWPLLQQSGVDQSYGEAVKSVKHKLEWEYKKHGPRYVLAMGEIAAQMLFERYEPLSALKGVEFTLKGGETPVKGLATHSLSEALQLDWVKPSIWRDVQPLLKRIAADKAANSSSDPS